MSGPVAGSRRRGGWVGSGPLSGHRKSTGGGEGPGLPIRQSDVIGLPQALADRPTRDEMEQALEDVPVWTEAEW